MSIASEIVKLHSELPSTVKLVAVSKFHPASAVMEAYNAGQRVFGENRPQELFAKAKELPADIEWHFIGHLQTNKLKMVLPFASIVESVDSLHLLEAIDRWGRDNSKVVDVLLELHVAAEETKQGFDADEIRSIMFSPEPFANIRFRGLMGMATLTSDEHVIEADFGRIVSLFDELSARIGDSPKLTADFNLRSFGMTHDYGIAVRMGANIVRIGTLIFGARPAKI
ncbi:YggS family pyridoxal phosphate enzyme [Muribaculum sp. An289]|uniref:YggS family pyridoxal phosphate-dependent enzyme n=1 Tax=unclassified Muribaculum TaxID=2622126 RepID=UPI000B37C41C|nr:MULTISPECIES: YggS family pyridoxal phosphate-dependent enzyme [unclassified Muribaculum]OUO37551.1 YggS family pyridoxal phosphate enzyme [Muribaculum sp. An289]OUO43470.1 YggS family pyridoxal phosphate enzyme [Muribaculum sp. An287]